MSKIKLERKGGTLASPTGKYLLTRSVGRKPEVWDLQIKTYEGVKTVPNFANAFWAHHERTPREIADELSGLLQYDLFRKLVSETKPDPDPNPRETVFAVTLKRTIRKSIKETQRADLRIDADSYEEAERVALETVDSFDWHADSVVEDQDQDQDQDEETEVESIQKCRLREDGRYVEVD